MVEGGDTTPLKGHTILAIDPGFENARKSAVISLTCWYDPGTGGGGGGGTDTTSGKPYNTGY